MNGGHHFAVMDEVMEKSLHASFQIVRYVLTAGLFGGLIVAWILTAPLFRCGVFLGDARRRWDLGAKWR